MAFSYSDLFVIAPEIILTALALVVIFVELAWPRCEAALQAICAVGILLAGAAAAISLGVQTTAGFGSASFLNGMVAADGFSVFLKVILATIALLIVLISRSYFSNAPNQPTENIGEQKSASLVSRLRHSDYYSLILLTTVGMMVLASATDLVALFIGLETMSVGLYCLAGIRFERVRSSESALKYLLLGAFASAFLLFGIALIYGATNGATNFKAIVDALQGSFSSGISLLEPAPAMKGTPLLLAGIGFLLIGLLFKIAAVPFHFWSPDVYQGAPTPVTAFMSAGPKAAALAVFIRLFGWVLPGLSTVWAPMLWLIAALTMTVGNIIALAQTDVKRMLAYSSIAHAGYLLLAILAAGNPQVREAAAAGMLFYLTIYYLMNIGAFAVVYIINRARENSDYQIGDYYGLAAKQPWVAGVLALCLISLAGIPPTAGFFSKLYVFSAAVKAGYIGLVVIAVLNSVVSVYYYLRLVVYMYMRPLEKPLAARLTPTTAVALMICTIGILGLGLLPGGLMKQAQTGAAQIELPVPTVE
ncbi:MAG: NADH-quinone oxidoreductase subunit N [Calditrichaeota bacterium]|nr:NADH-quinone oxidoreductase subunit N [Calditrichota bacterium]